MYPQGELKRLACTKTALRERIGESRAETADAIARVARPLVRIDRALNSWRRLPTWSRITLAAAGVIATRRFLFSPRALRRLVRWSPLAFRMAGTLRRAAGR